MAKLKKNGKLAILVIVECADKTNKINKTKVFINYSISFLIRKYIGNYGITIFIYKHMIV